VAYRYWCGECGFRTPWLTRSDAERRQLDHYAARHPGVEPGGHVEVSRRRRGGRRGCLMASAVLLWGLPLLVVAWCHG
jgi:hypothetical protein